AVHAIDAIPWLTGRTITQVVAARAWNARLPQHPNFQDAAQIMLKLDNGGGVMGDLSYLASDGIAYASPQYWRVTCHRDAGVLETSFNRKSVELSSREATSSRSIPADTGNPTGCLDAFLNEIESLRSVEMLRTADVLDASRRTL